MKIFTSFLLFLSFNTLSQIGVGEWRMHIAERRGLDIAAGNGKVVEAVMGGIVIYDIAAGETRTKDKVKGLSESDVTCVYYDSHSTSFFIGYSNGNIDQLLEDESVVNIPGVVLAPITGNKRINKFTPKDGKVMAATGFGIVLLDGYRHEIADTWYPDTTNSAFNDVCVHGDSIYAIQNNQLFRARKSSAFLADPNQWQLDPRFPAVVNSHYGEILSDGTYLYYSQINENFGLDTVFRLSGTTRDVMVGSAFSMEITRITRMDNGIGASLYGGFFIYSAPETLSFGFNMLSDGTFAQPANVVKSSGFYFVADRQRGLIRKIGEGDNLFLASEGPMKDEFFSVTAEDEKLVFTGGILDAVTFNYRLAGAYSLENEQWQLYDNSIPNWPAGGFDYGVAAIDPNNPENVALGSYSPVPLILLSGNTVSHSYTTSNSNLTASTVNPLNTCVSSMRYDDDGNLWVLNCYSAQPLKMRSAAGVWYAMNTGTNSVNRFTGDLIIDENGNKWFPVAGKGLIGFKDNGTPTVTTDDSYCFLTTGEGSGNLPSTNITALTLDQENQLWIGTEEGFAILYNPESAFGTGTDVSRILIDFEGNVEYLLGEARINDIAVDGANRKWMGTEGSGIFCLSASGQDVLTNYTTENSPLLSNQILDMDFNLRNGELFIVTSEGLISLRTDATLSAETYDSTIVFPNPVTPGYSGPITIQGIRGNSDVRITDIAGNLIYKTSSNGGTATWNGKRLTGEDVTSGVYLIWTAVNSVDDKGKKVGKVVVVR